MAQDTTETTVKDPDQQVVYPDTPVSVGDIAAKAAFRHVGLWGTMNALKQNLELGRIMSARQLGDKNNPLSQQAISDMLTPSPLGNSIVNITTINSSPAAAEAADTRTTAKESVVASPPIARPDPVPKPAPVAKPAPAPAPAPVAKPDPAPAPAPVAKPVPTPVAPTPPKVVTDAPAPPAPTAAKTASNGNGMKTAAVAGIASLIGAGLLASGLALKSDPVQPKIYEGEMSITVPITYEKVAQQSSATTSASVQSGSASQSGSQSGSASQTGATLPPPFIPQESQPGVPDDGSHESTPTVPAEN